MKNKIIFANMSEHVRNVFDNDETSFEGYRNLCMDLTTGRAIFDADGNTIAHADAEKTAREIAMKIFGIDEHSTKRDRKRAIKAHKDEFFAVSEEDIDIKVDTGLRDNEFFNTYVDQRNIARGDDIEFYAPDKVYLSVVQVAGDHHSYTVQRLGAGQSYTVPMSTYGIAVGADIDLYLTGRLDWTKFTDQCAAAFLRKIQNDAYTAMMNVGDKLPAQFVKNGALSSSVKDNFDDLIESVQMANDGSPIVIMGTQTALKKINALTKVDWASNEQKGEMAKMGRLGSYEGVVLMEIPQRFDLNDTSKKIIDNTKLFIMPQADNKFIKLVDQGEAEITEILDKAARNDDTMFYQVERSFGIGVQLNRYFGVWKLA